jgi:hypothetical protein
MTPSVMDWVDGVVRAYGLGNLSVLDVGSLDVNGSVRGLFAGAYTGLDLRPGPNVDVVADVDTWVTGHHWPVVISTEMLEHCRRPWVTMHRLADLSSDWVIVTARGFEFPRHEHPIDYWRFSVGSLSLLMGDAGLDVCEVVDDPGSSGVFGVGRHR